MGAFRWVAAIAAAVAGLSASAATVTSVPGDIDLRVVRFSPYDGVTTESTISGSIDVGTAETGEAVNLSFNPDGEPRILGAVPTSLGDNGTWPASGGYAGLNAPSGEMTFRFTRGMNFVGGYINLDPDSYDGDLTITAYDDLNNVLEELVVGFRLGSPGGTGLGEFHGFVRAAADIWRITLSNKEVVIDDLSFGTRSAVVPEARPAELLGAALLAATLLGVARRRKAALSTSRPARSMRR